MDQGLMSTWRQLLKDAIGDRTLNEKKDPETTALLATFQDAAGNSHGLDRRIAANVARGIATARGGSVEFALWRSLAGPAAPVEPGELVDLSGAGPLLPERRDEGIEAWHGAELVALHALSWHAAHDPQWSVRCDSAAAWMLDEVQPDNATNRPWAIHWFISMAVRGVRAIEAEMYAQTLLHNARVSDGASDALGLSLLIDSARRLQTR